MIIDLENIMQRRLVWEQAEELIKPIIFEHQLETYRTGAPLGPSTTYTKVDQHLEHITRLADWLLEQR